MSHFGAVVRDDRQPARKARFWANDPPTVDSLSVVTTAANRFMERIHYRMPVILGWKEEKEWLDPKNDDNPTLLKSLIRPCPDDWLDAHEVSTLA